MKRNMAKHSTGKMDHAIREIHHVDREKGSCSRSNELHPLAKLSVTILYMLFVVSVENYHPVGLLYLLVYPLAMMILYDISFIRCMKRLKVVFFFVFCMGIANPIFNRIPVLNFWGITLTAGMLSMITLWMKALLTVLAGYILMEMTTMDQICYGLRCIHVPAGFVVLLSLIYRYLILFLKETDRMMKAYQLRAPGQKGVHFRVWGSLLGNLLLRTMDQGQRVYESMTLRGFRGEYYLHTGRVSKRDSYLFVGIWMGIFVILKLFPIVYR